MTSQPPDLAAVLARLDRIHERISRLEFQVSGLMQSESVEAEAFVLRDDRGEIRARLDLRDHAPRLTFYAQIEGSVKNPPIRTPSLPMLQKLAKVLTVKLTDLLEEGAIRFTCGKWRQCPPIIEA